MASDFRPGSAPYELPGFANNGKISERWLSVPAQQERRKVLGLSKPATAQLVAANEFVSLGCFCGVARALQALGLTKFAYPFDWVRCSSDGIVSCIDKRFADFLTFTSILQQGEFGPAIFTTVWGGSIWHHDPQDSQIVKTFTRRAMRFLGLGEVAPARPRIFIRAVNSTRELDDVPRLLQALKKQLPVSSIRLLVLVDCQLSEGPRRLQNSSGQDLLFYFFRRALREPLDPGHGDWSGLKRRPMWSMEEHAEMYAKAIAFAARYWAGEEGSPKSIPVLPASYCEQQWDGGCPTRELFEPKLLRGQLLQLPKAEPPALTKAASESSLKQPARSKRERRNIDKV